MQMKNKVELISAKPCLPEPLNKSCFIVEKLLGAFIYTDAMNLGFSPHRGDHFSIRRYINTIQFTNE